MIEGIIWDIDGVILDSEDLHAETESQTAKAFGIEITPEEIKRVYSGVSIEKELADIAQRFQKKISLERALAIRKQILEKQLERGVPLVENAKEVLTQLSSQYPMAFATQSERYFIDEALGKSGVLSFFKARIYAEDVTTPKPDPDMFFKAATALNVNPQKILVIEDSPSGFEAAKAAGMLLVARRVHHNMGKDFSLADYIVDDLREVPKILAKI